MYREEQDAFGRLVMAYYQGEEVHEIIERDDGLINTSAGPAAYFEPFEAWPPHVQQAVDFARGRVLDIGCGVGRHAIPLQERGLDVLGVDLSPLSLEVAQKRGLRKTHCLSITQISRELGQFDTITMLGNNFGLMANERRARWLLRRFHKMTSSQGRIITDSTDVLDTERAEHLAYHERNRSRGRLPGQLRLRVRYLKYKSPWFDYLMVGPDEMARLLEGTGWAIGKVLQSDGPQYAAIIEKVGQA